MPRLATLYKPSLALLTDLYQLTMAYGYWKTGRQDLRASFHLFFRKNPFAGGYTVACGIADAVEWLASARFDQADRDYLASLTGADHQPLFDAAFLDHLADFRFSADAWAVQEGAVVFPHEPLIRLEGPLWQCQLAETALLNLINFPSLIATKAARICHAAAGDPVIEFGARRAQGVDGALSATRAAYIGGAAATSNTLAGRLSNIPTRGTHAHSWVMSFATEVEAFEKYAEAMPGNALLLVDTYDTLQGVRHAAEVGRKLKARGQRLLGVRLDSGDLAYLSTKAREILDEAGLHDTSIVASNDLDEQLIESLKTQGARIDTWGVGTNLATGGDQCALGGVYKLGAIQRGGSAGDGWSRTLKMSDSASKASVPGILQVRRFRDGTGAYVADAIYDTLLGCPSGEVTVVDPADASRRKAVRGLQHDDLLVPVLRAGQPVPGVFDEPIADIRARAKSQLDALHPTIRRLVNPHAYPAGLELALHDTRFRMMLDHRATAPSATPSPAALSGRSRATDTEAAP